MDDFYRDVEIQEMEFRNRIDRAHYHLDSYVDYEYGSKKYIPKKSEQEMPENWVDAHLTEAVETLERLLGTRQDVNLVMEMAQQDYTSRPPIEPLEDRKRDHENLIMRFIALYESGERSNRIDDSMYASVEEMFEENSIPLQRDISLEGGEPTTYKQLIPEELISEDLSWYTQ